MPRTNTRSYSNDRNSNNNSNRGGYSSRSSSRSRGRQQDTRASKFGKDNFNMLNFGQAFLDETPGKSFEFKARVLLKTKDGQLADVVDGDGKGDNEYTPEESAMLIAKALLEGRAINICFFSQDDGSWGGNARIDIKGIEGGDADDDDEEEPAPKKSAKAKAPAAKAKAKPRFEVPEDDEDDSEEVTEVDDEGESIPY